MLIAENVFRTHQPALVAYLERQLSGDRQSANDIAQEAFVRIVQAKRPYEPSEARGLLYKIARNLVIDHARAQRTRRVTEDTVAGDHEDGDVLAPDRHVAARQELALVEEAILALPPRCQQVYVLHRFEGMSYGAISAHCGISLSVVEKHMQKALKRLVKALEPAAPAQEIQ